jgi:hypothetical protein
MSHALHLRVGFLAALILAGHSGMTQADPATPAAVTEAGAVASPLGPLPAGWTVALTDVIAIYSAPSDEGSVTVIAPPVITVEGDIRSAIIERAPALIEELFGEARPAGEPVPLPASEAVAPGLLVPLVVALDDGSEARIEATGYPLPGNRMQLYLVALPTAMSDSNAAIKTARTLIERWRASGLAVTEKLTSQVVAPPEPRAREDSSESDATPQQTPAPSIADSQAQQVSPDEQVENVIYFLRYAFDGANPAAGGEPAATTALLLKDGRVFEGEPSAPAAFDPASRPPGSAGTGRWQRDGEAYALAFSDGTQGTAVAGAAKTFPAPAAMAFAGAYRAIGGPATDLLPDQIDFYPDGSLLLKSPGRVLGGSYEITQRSVRMAADGQRTMQFLFGFRGEMQEPELLILGNRIYERAGT